MDEKLRRLLESRCRALPGGGWLVEVPVVRAVPAPAYVLPDEATKEEYVARAVPVGRAHLMSDFFVICGLLPIQSRLLVSPQFGFLGDPAWWLAALLCVAVLIVWRQSPAGREGERLRAWLQHVGRGAPLDSEPIEARPRGWGWWGRLRDFKRCRPGWMVFAETAALCAFAASIIVSSFAIRYECQKALAVWWEAGASIASFPDGCIESLSWFGFATAGLVIAFAAATAWDWWRWNLRRA